MKNCLFVNNKWMISCSLLALAYAGDVMAMYCSDSESSLSRSSSNFVSSSNEGSQSDKIAQKTMEPDEYKQWVDAAKEGNYELMKSFVDRVDVDEVQGNELSALLWAIVYGHGDIIDLLIENGADVNLQNKQGITAGELAVMIGDIEILEKIDSWRNVSDSESSFSQSSSLSNQASSGSLDSACDDFVTFDYRDFSHMGGEHKNITHLKIEQREPDYKEEKALESTNYSDSGSSVRFPDLEVLKIFDLSLIKAISWLHLDKLKKLIINPVWRSHSDESKKLTINDLSKDIGNLKNLEELNLRDCRLHSFPDSLSKLTKLRTLDVSQNGFVIRGPSEDIGNLENLEELNLRDCRLHSFPDSLSKLTKLRTLDVSQNGFVIRGPSEDIGNLENLEELNLRDCRLHSFPDSLSKLTKLKVLDISKNGFNKISDVIFEIPNLKKLIISIDYLSKEDASLMKELLEKNIEVRDEKGKTSLMIAVMKGWDDIIDLFIKREAIDSDFVDIEDNEGNTALHWAVDSSNVSAVEKLINSGADVNLRNKKWYTPLWLCIEKEKPAKVRGEMMELLLEHGGVFR